MLQRTLSRFAGNLPNVGFNPRYYSAFTASCWVPRHVNVAIFLEGHGYYLPTSYAFLRGACVFLAHGTKHDKLVYYADVLLIAKVCDIVGFHTESGAPGMLVTPVCNQYSFKCRCSVLAH